MNFNDFNIGRGLVYLGKERKVLDKDFSQQELREKKELFAGIIQGYLETGGWNTAVGLIYGKRLEGLFDKDRQRLREDLLHFAKEKKVTRINPGTLEKLIENYEYNLIYDLLVNVDLEGETTLKLVEALEEKQIFSSERQLQVYRIAKACKDLDSKKLMGGLLYGAHQTKNNELITEMYYDLLACGKRIEDDDLVLLVEVAKADPSLRQERMLELAKRFLDKVSVGLQLYEEVTKYKEGLREVEKKRLLESAAQNSSLERRMEPPEHRRGEKVTDPLLRLAWAKKAAKSEPALAYKIFKEQAYFGLEALESAKSGLSVLLEANKSPNRTFPRSIPVRALRSEEIEGIYSDADVEIKRAIALELKDNNRLLELSKEYLEKGCVEEAYDLYVAGEGNLEEPHVSVMREVIIKKSLEKSASFSVYLFPKDEIGQRRWYEAVFERSPEVAYKIALDLKDDALVSRAREGLLKGSPSAALHVFSSPLRDKDEIGINEVVTKVAKQLDLNPEVFLPYLGR